MENKEKSIKELKERIRYKIRNNQKLTREEYEFWSVHNKLKLKF